MKCTVCTKPVSACACPELAPTAARSTASLMAVPPSLPTWKGNQHITHENTNYLDKQTLTVTFPGQRLLSEYIANTGGSDFEVFSSWCSPQWPTVSVVRTQAQFWLRSSLRLHESFYENSHRNTPSPTKSQNTPILWRAKYINMYLK